MQKLVYYCDRCGALIGETAHTAQLHICGGELRADLCEGCGMQIWLAVNAFMEGDAEEPEETQEDDPDEDPAEDGPERHPMDYRQLRQMVVAKKTPKQIAEYFGITVGSYYYHRRKSEELFMAGMLS